MQQLLAITQWNSLVVFFMACGMPSMQQLTIIRKGLLPLAFRSRPPIGPKSHMARTPFCVTEGKKSDKDRPKIQLKYL